MAINEVGRQQLIDDLRANAAHYNQNHFGTQQSYLIKEDNECGTIMCMAGFCRLREVGWEQYLKDIFSCEDNVIIAAGVKQLGIVPDSNFTPDIFNNVSNWPIDLRVAYDRATTNKQRVEVAVQALMRLKENGEIEDNGTYKEASLDSNG